ncbi:MAG: RNase H family protein [Candidatus Levyibacteriota bacterium]
MSDICKNCGSPLVKKLTKRTAEQLKKPYYYSAYYYCNNCRKLYHSDEFKVMNAQTTPLFLGSLNTNSAAFDAEIWTDGACVSNGTPNARAAWAFVSGKTERAGRVEGKQTNNVAEGLAIYNALVWAAEKGHKRVKLYTDSQISLFNLQKTPDKVKQNAEIFHSIAQTIADNGLSVEYVKVLGHSGDPNNERADKLANTLATQR